MVSLCPLVPIILLTPLHDTFTVDTATETEANETSQAQKLDQSEAADEALYLPPLPPDQLDTVVKVMLSTCMHTPTHSVHVVYSTEMRGMVVF